jgi:hypothetical protein
LLRGVELRAKTGLALLRLGIIVESRKALHAVTALRVVGDAVGIGLLHKHADAKGGKVIPLCAFQANVVI